MFGKLMLFPVELVRTLFWLFFNINPLHLEEVFLFFRNSPGENCVEENNMRFSWKKSFIMAYAFFVCFGITQHIQGMEVNNDRFRGIQALEKAFDENDIGLVEEILNQKFCANDINIYDDNTFLETLQKPLHKECSVNCLAIFQAKAHKDNSLMIRMLVEKKVHESRIYRDPKEEM